MTTSIRLLNVLMRALLLAGIVSFGLASNVNAFGRLSSRCGLVSVGSTNQEKVIRLIKRCLYKDYRISFYSFYWLDGHHKEKIFDGVPSDSQQLIVIFNGIDENYLNDQTLKGSEAYNRHYAVLKENRLKIDEIFSRLKIPRLTKNCMNLITTKGCYAEARRKLKLPSLVELKRHVYWVDL